MEKYRFRDVPKGKRLSYFISYYGKLTLILAAVAVMLGYGIYELALRPGADVSILWMGNDYDLAEENVTRSEMEKLDWDMNQDGTTRVDMHYIDFSASYNELDSDAQMEAMLQTSAVGYYIYFADDDALDWLETNKMLGTWSDANLNGPLSGSALLEIPAAELTFFQGENRDVFQNITVCISVPPSDRDEQAAEAYRLQMEALSVLIS